MILALEAGELETLTPIRLRWTGELLDLTVARDDQAVLQAEVQATLFQGDLDEETWRKAIGAKGWATPIFTGSGTQPGVGVPMVLAVARLIAVVVLPTPPF